MMMMFDDDDAYTFTLIYKEEETIDVKTLLAHMVDGQTTFVNIEKLTNRLLVTYPFPHAVIDDFLQSDKLPKILAEVYDTRNSNYGSYLRRLFVELNSPDFIKHIELITGVNNIICNDISLHGTGIHGIKSKGFSQLHADFNTYHSKNRRLDRRVNLLIYLNPDWKSDEFNGALCLCDKNTNMCAKKIDPILNRCVIFNTTRDSIYGHPETLNSVAGQQYIAVYYYTENTQGDADVDFEGETPRNTTWYPDIHVSAKPKQIFYV